MPRTLQDWLREGQELYEAAMKDYKDLQSRLEDLEAQLEEKQHEVNQIAAMIGKPAAQPSRRLSARIVEAGNNGGSSSPAAIARALTGGGLDR